MPQKNYEIHTSKLRLVRVAVDEYFVLCQYLRRRKYSSTGSILKLKWFQSKITGMGILYEPEAHLCIY